MYSRYRNFEQKKQKFDKKLFKNYIMLSSIANIIKILIDCVQNLDNYFVRSKID